MSQGAAVPVVASPASAPPLEPELPELDVDPEPLPELDGPLDPELLELLPEEDEPPEPGLPPDPEPPSGFAVESDEPLDPEAEPLLAPVPGLAVDPPSPEPHAQNTAGPVQMAKRIHVRIGKISASARSSPAMSSPGASCRCST